MHEGRRRWRRRLSDGLSALTLLSCLIIAAVLLCGSCCGKALSGRRRFVLLGLDVFCAFGAVGLYVLVSLVLALLPESWMEEYGKAMRLSTETGLIPALAVVAAPLAEELVPLASSSRGWNGPCRCGSQLLQAVLHRFIHGTRCRSATRFHGLFSAIFAIAGEHPTIAAAFNAI